MSMYVFPSSVFFLNILIFHSLVFMGINGSDPHGEDKNAVSSRKSMSTAGFDGDPNPEGILDLNFEIRSCEAPELEYGEPFIKRIRLSQGDGGGDLQARYKATIGKMFFKTKLCCKFRAGICPYITNCNFAHGIEELRRPPSNWQDIMALYEEQGGTTPEFIREENQIPTFTSYDMLGGGGGGGGGESQRSYKGRHCKKFYTEEGCPYGENCTFLHDEQSRVRESVAISLSPAVGGGGSNGNGQNQKPSNWKTRICNKWETTGSCPFGSKCHFAHGLQELHRYGGGLVDMGEGKESCTSTLGVAAVITSEAAGGQTLKGEVWLNSDGSFHGGGRPPSVNHNKPPPSQFHLLHKWKGPEKISRIYGDWIDDFQ